MKYTTLLFSAGLLGFNIANAAIGFTPNHGQIIDQLGKPANNVLFKACGTGPGIFVTTTGLTYVFENRRNEILNETDVEAGRKNEFDWSAIRMELIGANILSENIVVENQLPGVSNYYYAHCPNGILGVKSYHKITIKNIYPGIDWVISADDASGVAHDFVVHASGDYKNIRMKYSGLSAPISINEKLQLVLTSPQGIMYEGGLKVIALESKKQVRSYFSIDGNVVSYVLVRVPVGCGVMIDPPLQWDTTLASSGMDYGSGVAACRDNSMDVLGCGYTDGTDFPVWNADQGVLAGQEDAVVYRRDASGNALWATYFGGTDIDNAKGISTDILGNAYVVGHTASQDLPVMGSLQPNYGGGLYDAFIAKFNAAGTLQWASWRGGTGSDFGTAIAINQANSNVYVVGYTNTTLNFPVLNAIQSSNAGVYDGFIMSLSSNQTMAWSTFYGGTDEDKFRAVAFDPSLFATPGILVAGNTMSGNFPTVAPFQTFNGQAWFTSDAVIMKITSGQSVLFATYCGGDEDDIATGITADDQGNVYTTGYTNSTDFPKVYLNGAYNDTVLNATLTNDAFIVKCNAYGNTLLWSSFFGGTAPDYGYAIGYDQFVGIYICGNTASTDLPVQQPLDLNYYQPTHGDGGTYNDGFIAWFDVTDTLAWSTYYGFSNSEEAYAVSVSSVGDLYVTGVNFNDIYLAKFNSGLPTGTQVCGYGVGQTQPFPNPAHDEVSIIFAASEGVATIQIHDVTGRLIREQQVSTYFGENWIHINIADLSAGEYNLSVISTDRNDHHKFVKQ